MSVSAHDLAAYGIDADLLTAQYPAFSRVEMARRRTALEAIMASHNIGHLVLWGAQRAGPAIQWLTGWPVTAAAAVVVTPGMGDVMLVQYHNHVPLARQLAATTDVRWGGPSTAAALVALLAERLKGGRGGVGFIGPMGYRLHQRLSQTAGPITDLSEAFQQLRLIKSAEEIDWLRVGACFSDRAVMALQRSARLGMSEHELANIVERAYVSLGGTTFIHYIGVTPMADPQVAVPRQFTATRSLADGDIITAEIRRRLLGLCGPSVAQFSPLVRRRRFSAI